MTISSPVGTVGTYTFTSTDVLFEAVSLVAPTKHGIVTHPRWLDDGRVWASLLDPVAQPGREVFYQATSFDAVTGAATALSSYEQGSVL